MTVYIVVWSNFNNDWTLNNVFSSRAKAENHIRTKDNMDGYWIVEREVE
jgi:hypothetical protein